MAQTASRLPVADRWPRGFVPSVGAMLTVELPGERMRVEVRAVHDLDHVVVLVSSVPVSKNHQYRQGDTLIAERRHGDFGEVWEAIDDRLLAMRALEEKLTREAAAAPPPQPAQKEKRRVGRK